MRGDKTKCFEYQSCQGKVYGGCDWCGIFVCEEHSSRFNEDERDDEIEWNYVDSDGIKRLICCWLDREELGYELVDELMRLEPKDENYSWKVVLA